MINEGLLKDPSDAGGYIRIAPDQSTEIVVMPSRDNTRVVFYGGNGYSKGATLMLNGVNYSTLLGAFTLHANDGINRSILAGNSNGNLTWGSGTIDSICSFGSNYIQYTNGLGICWVKSGNTTVPPSKITFPFSFIDIPAISISPRGSAASNVAYIHKVSDVSSTGCIVMAVKTTTASEYVVSTYTLIAIGIWKPV